MNPDEFWFSFLAQTLLRGAAWLLAVTLIAALVRRKSAAQRALVWQMGFVGLILLPVLLFAAPPIAVRNPGALRLYSGVVPSPPAAALPQSEPVAASVLPVVKPHAARTSVASGEKNSVGPQSLTSSVAEEKPRLVNRPAARLPERAPAFAVVKWVLFVGWGAGVAWSLLSILFSAFSLRRLVGSAEEASEALKAERKAAADSLKLNREVTLIIASLNSNLHAPITWGMFRPVVMLPSYYAAKQVNKNAESAPSHPEGTRNSGGTEQPTALRLPQNWGQGGAANPAEGTDAHTDRQSRIALLHELAHVKRSDWAWLICAQVVSSLYWCVPFVWIAARRLRHEIEMACDDCVLNAGVSPASYAAQLLEAARSMTARNGSLPAGVLTMARPPLAEVRIRAILGTDRRRQPSSGRILAFAALLPLIVVPLLALRAVAAPEAAKRYAGEFLKPESGMSSPELPNFNYSPAIEPLRTAGKPASISSASLRRAMPGSDSVSAITREAKPDNARIEIADNLARLQPAEHKMEPQKNHANSEAVGNVTLRRQAQDAGGTKPERMLAIVWGPVQDGLQAGLRMVDRRMTFASGEEIWQEVYLRNRTDKEVEITASGGYEQQGRPKIETAAGQSVKVLQFFGMGAMYVVSRTVPPGEIGLIFRVGVQFYAPDNTGETPKEVAPGLSFFAEDMALALAGQGVYSLRQELSPHTADGKTIWKPLLTGAIDIRIEGKPVPFFPHKQQKIPDLATAPIAWGPIRSGLQAGLMYLEAKSHYFVGERVRLVSVLRNVSNAKISFWHETSFAHLPVPTLAGEKTKTVLFVLGTKVPAAKWLILQDIHMTGVTFDMTYAPSADGPSSIRRTDINPGQAVIGYYLTEFIAPQSVNRKPIAGRYRVTQPVHLGLGDTDRLDTTLTTGTLDMQIMDPDKPE